MVSHRRDSGVATMIEPSYSPRFAAMTSCRNNPCDKPGSPIGSIWRLAFNALRASPFRVHGSFSRVHRNFRSRAHRKVVRACAKIQSREQSGVPTSGVMDRLPLSRGQHSPNQQELYVRCGLIRTRLWLLRGRSGHRQMGNRLARGCSLATISATRHDLPLTAAAQHDWPMASHSVSSCS